MRFYSVGAAGLNRGGVLGLWISIAAAIEAGFIAHWLAGLPRGRQDFAIFWAAGQGGSIYDPAVIAHRLIGVIPPGITTFPYLPTALPIFAPFSILPFPLAVSLWVGLSALALLLSSENRLAPLLVVSPAVGWALASGQTSVVVGALLYGGLRLRDRPITSGAMFAVALALKPQIAILIPLGLLARRDWRALWSCAAVGLMMVLISAVLFGPDLWVQWWTAAPHVVASTREKLAVYMIAPRLAVWARILIGLTGALLTWRAFRSDDPAKQSIVAVSTALLVSPYAIGYDLAALAPAMLSIGARQDWRVAPVGLFLIGPGLIYAARDSGILDWSPFAWLLGIALALGAIGERSFLTHEGGAVRPAEPEGASDAARTVSPL